MSCHHHDFGSLHCLYQTPAVHTGFTRLSARSHTVNQGLYLISLLEKAKGDLVLLRIPVPFLLRSSLFGPTVLFVIIEIDRRVQLLQTLTLVLAHGNGVTLSFGRKLLVKVNLLVDRNRRRVMSRIFGELRNRSGNIIVGNGSVTPLNISSVKRETKLLSGA